MDGIDEQIGRQIDELRAKVFFLRQTGRSFHGSNRPNSFASETDCHLNSAAQQALICSNSLSQNPIYRPSACAGHTHAPVTRASSIINYIKDLLPYGCGVVFKVIADFEHKSLKIQILPGSVLVFCFFAWSRLVLEYRLLILSKFNPCLFHQPLDLISSYSQGR